MRKRWTLVAAACLTTGSVVAAGTGHTFASFSDSRTVTGNSVTAGVWRPDPPAACGDLANYKGGVIYGTFGDDVIDLRGANQAQIIMGLAGNDTIYAGNSGDCLVGGDGNDTLIGGNAKDILLGGPGNDYLNGNNGKDSLDGGGDDDTCDGGNGTDTITNCGGTP